MAVQKAKKVAPPKVSKQEAKTPKSNLAKHSVRTIEWQVYFEKDGEPVDLKKDTFPKLAGAMRQAGSLIERQLNRGVDPADLVVTVSLVETDSKGTETIDAFTITAV